MAITRIPKIFLNNELKILDKDGNELHSVMGRVEDFKTFSINEFTSVSSETSHRIFINNDLLIGPKNYILYNDKRYQVLSCRRLETFGKFNHLEIIV